MQDNILELRGVSKEFPGVKALDNINLDIKRGEIHAIIGENGAGKSTMMKIISGVYPKGSYSGSLVYDGEIRQFSSIRDSEEAGISIIYQELALVKMINIAENVFLGNEVKNKFGTINKNQTIQETTRCLKKVSLNLNPMTLVVNLGIGQQQLVAIAKALSKKTKLLILDEPTAPLTDRETENLFEILRKLRKDDVSCVFISHKLEEVFAIADRVTIIRDGKNISCDNIAELTDNIIVSRMVGRQMDDRYPKEKHTAGKRLMEVRNWTLKDPELTERKLIDNISFSLQEGEILGIAGLMGAGRTELSMSLFGWYPGYISGELFIDGKKAVIKEPQDAINRGLVYLSEDRKRFGLNMKMDIEDNITLASLQKLSYLGVINNNKKIVETKRYIKKLYIKTPSSKQMVVNLSGGNQQKVVLGKWLMTKPKILILDEPTRGIDVGAKYEIYVIINKLVKEGVGVIMISSELPELLGMADRILVIHEGKLTGELNSTETTQEKIMMYATGRIG
jgi:ABC-type sugar transport system ATPase subunit